VSVLQIFRLDRGDSYCIILSSKFKATRAGNTPSGRRRIFIINREFFSKEVHGLDLCGFGGMQLKIEMKQKDR
jgi:hypothetical protein